MPDSRGVPDPDAEGEVVFKLDGDADPSVNAPKLKYCLVSDALEACAPQEYG